MSISTRQKARNLIDSNQASVCQYDEVMEVLLTELSNQDAIILKANANCCDFKRCGLSDEN